MAAEQKTSWYIVDAKGRYLTIGGLSSRYSDCAFVDDPTRQTAERFDAYHHARDFIAWQNLTDVRIIDYADLGAAPVFNIPDNVPTREQLIADALKADAERFKERLRTAWEIRKGRLVHP